MLSGLTLDLESGFSLYDNTTKVIDYLIDICGFFSTIKELLIISI